jgi:hypothetical protein
MVGEVKLDKVMFDRYLLYQVRLTATGVDCDDGSLHLQLFTDFVDTTSFPHASSWHYETILELSMASGHSLNLISIAMSRTRSLQLKVTMQHSSTSVKGCHKQS